MKPAPKQPPSLVVDEAPTSSPRLRPTSLDAGTLIAREADGYRLQLLDGDVIHVTLARGLSPALADECLRDTRLVLVTTRTDPPQLLGALQTTPSPIATDGDVVTLRARELHLEAEQRVTLGTDTSRLSLGEGGKLSLLGDRLTMSVASLIKMIASKVELP